MKRKLIVLEFNELCPSLMTKFMEMGKLPNFSKLYETSAIYTTDAKTSGSLLNPWVQWVTIHTGMSIEEHGVTRLNEASELGGRFVWDTLSSKGYTSWICGSMNTGYADNFKGLLLPDPWSESVQPYPPGQFDVYSKFVASAVHGVSTKSTPSPFRFLKFILSSGLSAGTIWKIGTQLLSEVFDKSVKWRRASVLDWIQYDLFRHKFIKEQPDFSTFFLNSTAHYQHHYWSEMQQEQNSDDKNSSSKSKAVITGYQSMDKLLGRSMKLAKDHNCDILFCTGLSQQEYVFDDPTQKRHYYHIHSADGLFKTLDIPNTVKYTPMMAEQFQLHCKNAEEATALREKLGKFYMDSDEYFHEGSNQLFLSRTDNNVVYVQCRCTKFVHENATILETDSDRTIPFSELFYLMDDVKSGMHHPLGMLWISESVGEHKIHDKEVGLEFVYDYILKYFDAAPKANA